MLGFKRRGVRIELRLRQAIQQGRRQTVVQDQHTAGDKFCVEVRLNLLAASGFSAFRYFAFRSTEKLPAPSV